MLDGGTTSSARNFCMQSNEVKLDNKNGLVNGTFMLHNANRPVPDEFYDSDYSQGNHEESIIWKGALVSNKVKDCCPSERPELEKCYVSDYEQDDIIMQKNDRIAWWASTWPSATELEEYDTLDSLSSSQTDSDRQMNEGSPLWSDKGLCQPFEQKMNWQRPVTANTTSTGSTQSKEKASSCSNDSHWKIPYEGSKNFTEFDLPLSQDNLELFIRKANMSHRLESMPTSIQHTESARDCFNDHKCKVFSCLSTSSTGDFAMRESLLEASRCIIDTEDLDRLVSKAKYHKVSMRKDMEEIYLLRQKVEQEELLAHQAKAGATHMVKDFLWKLDDLRQQTLNKRAQCDVQAAEVYGERSILSMEARELRSRLLETQAEQVRAMSLLDSVHCTLAERLQKASQEKDFAIEEAKLREEGAKKLLSYEENSARMLAEDLKALEREADTCRRLKEFLIERGNIIDSLQGEMLVLCEDILNFKKQVDAGIPLSSSRSLSWSHMSHLTQQSSSMNASINANHNGVSNLLEILRSPSILTVKSGPPSSVCPIDCTVQSQYFSSTTVPVEDVDVANKDMLNEEIEGSQ